MNRKGIIDDMFIWTGMIFTVGFSFLVIFLLMDGINTGIQDSASFGSKEKEVMQDLTTKYPIVWDYSFLVLFITSFIALMVIAWVLQSNPGLFFGVVFVVMLLGIFGAAMSNAYVSITSSGILGTVSLSFPITNFLLSNLVPFVLVTAFMMVIVFFAKPSGGIA